MKERMELLQVALSQYGVREFPGKIHNPIIVNYSHDIGYGGIIDDETAWCSIFMNWCALKSGLERSGELTARSWLKVGEEITEPEIGDIVIFYRGRKNGWKGHVGIYIGHSMDGGDINCLGGNQNDQVCIAPYDKKKLLGYRRLATVHPEEYPQVA